MQSNSEHPLAKAIVDYANEQMGARRKLEVKNFQVIAGRGVYAEVQSKKLYVGNQQLMTGSSLNVPSIALEYLQDMEKQARTGVLVAVENEIVGAIAISDPVKDDAAAVISILKSMGIQSIMVTGDNWGTANAIGREVGIDMIFAETQPQGKADKVKDLQVFMKLSVKGSS